MLNDKLCGNRQDKHQKLSFILHVIFSFERTIPLTQHMGFKPHDKLSVFHHLTNSNS